MLKIIDNLNYDGYKSNDFKINLNILNLTKEKNLLNVFVTSQKKSYVLNIVFENEEHEVIKYKYTILSKNVLQRTDLKQEYISLTNYGIIYYLPYN